MVTTEIELPPNGPGPLSTLISIAASNPVFRLPLVRGAPSRTLIEIFLIERQRGRASVFNHLHTRAQILPGTTSHSVYRWKTKEGTKREQTRARYIYIELPTELAMKLFARLEFGESLGEISEALVWQPSLQRIEKARNLAADKLSEGADEAALHYLVLACPISWSLENIIKPLQDRFVLNPVNVSGFLLAQVRSKISKALLPDAHGQNHLSEFELKNFQPIANEVVRSLGLTSLADFLREEESFAVNYLRDVRWRGRFYDRWVSVAKGIVNLTFFLLRCALVPPAKREPTLEVRLAQLVQIADLLLEEMSIITMPEGKLYLAARESMYGEARDDPAP